jgi:hypothetical protein
MGIQTTIFLVAPLEYLLGDTYHVFGTEVYTFVSSWDREIASDIALYTSVVVWSIIYAYAGRIHDIISLKMRAIRNRFVAQKLLPK